MLVQVTNFDMSNIKITQLKKIEGEFNFKHIIKDEDFSQPECIMYIQVTRLVLIESKS